MTQHQRQHQHQRQRQLRHQLQLQLQLRRCMHARSTTTTNACVSGADVLHITCHTITYPAGAVSCSTSAAARFNLALASVVCQEQ